MISKSAFDPRTARFWIFALFALVEVTLLVTPYRDSVIRQFGVSAFSPTSSWISYALIHAGILHFAMNSFVYLQTSPLIEGAIGAWRFIVFSVLCAAAAGFGGVHMYEFIHGQPTLIIGYSGVIFGYMGLLAVIIMRRASNKVATLKTMAKQNVLLIGFIIVPFIFPIGISAEAHLIGFLFGIVSAPIFLVGRLSKVGRLRK